jgi:oxygen-dependent protoporphyrinogen oxidase
MVSGLVGPFLTGVYAGDETQLGARAVFPGLVESEQRFGSLALGALFTRRAKGLKGSWSAPAGFGPFARKISDHLAEPPALGSRVVAIARDGSGFRVDVTSRSGDVTLSTSRVVVATPALEAATILRGVDAEVSSSLEQLRYAPIATVPLGVARRDLTEGLRGFGFLVPREEERALLGCLFMSQLFPDRAPEGCELLHCMLGGTRWPDAVSQGDDTLVERAVADLEGAIGLRGAPENLGVGRWERAIPQPGPEHPARMRWVQQRLAEEAPRLALAGAYVAGVSVSDALASGLAAGERVLSA